MQKQISSCPFAALELGARRETSQRAIEDIFEAGCSRESLRVICSKILGFWCLLEDLHEAPPSEIIRELIPVP